MKGLKKADLLTCDDCGYTLLVNDDYVWCPSCAKKVVPSCMESKPRRKKKKMSHIGHFV